MNSGPDTALVKKTAAIVDQTPEKASREWVVYRPHGANNAIANSLGTNCERGHGPVIFKRPVFQTAAGATTRRMGI